METPEAGAEGDEIDVAGELEGAPDDEALVAEIARRVAKRILTSRRK